MPFSAIDHAMMARALRLARRGCYTTQPNPRVGCVLTRDGDIVGEGFHEYAGGPHAEINALAQAGDWARGATAYVTLEPCSHTGKTEPCSQALIEAKVQRVIAAMEDPNPLVSGRGLQQLRESGIDASSGLMADEAAALNPGFIKRMREGMPWVRLKMAASLDGRTAMASGESKWITGTAARQDVQRLRARSDAILTGVGTVLADDPSMNVRLGKDELGIQRAPHQPLRVVLDTDLQTPPAARIFGEDGRLIILHDSDERDRQQALEDKGAELVQMPRVDGRLDLHRVLQWLAKREVNECHVEAGSVLAGALLRAALVDELIIYMAPHLMGDAARGIAAIPGLLTMSDRIAVEIDDIVAVGKDWRITAKVAR